jgi:hypothetical protein
MDGTGELRAAERRLQAAQLAADAEALDELLDDRLIFTFDRCYTKADDLALQRSGQQVLTKVDEEELTVKELDAIFDGTTNQGQVSGSGTDQPAAAQAPAEQPTWGKRYTWRDGLAVDIAPPVACTPGQFAAPQNIARAVKFSIVITNGTNAPFETALLSVGTDAQFDGKKAETVFDSSGGCDGSAFESTTVMPGKTYTYDVAYSVGPQPGELQLVLQPTFGSDKAVFTGPA